MSLAYKSVGWNRQKRIYDGVIAAGIVLYLALFVGVGFALHPEATAETMLIRGLGTCAFLMLHVVLSIGPLCRLDRRFLPLLYNRRHLGVAMFTVALLHGGFSLVQFHGFGDVNPLVSLLVGNTRFDSLAQFPFQPLGAIALLILFLMAATSHDFWLANLSAPVWKTLHMLVYAAYALVVMHVVLGVLQAETSPVLAGALGVGLAWVLGLHVVAALRERRRDVEPQRTARDEGYDGGFLDVCALADLEPGRGRTVAVAGERVALFRYDGKVSALSNACQHQNGPLGEGRIVNGCVVCPWHGYEYRPDCGRSPEPFTERVPTFRVRIDDGRVLVHPRPLPAGTAVPPAEIAGSAANDADDEPFYVGYRKQAPAALARFVRSRVTLVLLAAAVLGALLTSAQSPFARSYFEFGSERTFEGWVEANPYPTLVVLRPGTGAPTSRYLLVAFGKHGADAVVAGLVGKYVRLRGTLVYRDERTMIEVADGGVDEAAEQSPKPAEEALALGEHTIRGEIVDSKCFLGVMKPGNLKPHRACAVRCISGGIPPVLVARDAAGTATYYLLVSADGRPVNRDVLDMVAEPVAVTGELQRLGDQLVLYADPAAYKRLE